MEDPPQHRSTKTLSREDVKNELKCRDISPAGVPSDNVSRLKEIYAKEYEDAMALYEKSGLEME